MARIGNVDVPTSFSPDELVAYNIGRARMERKWTQEEAAERLEKYLGVRWSKASWSAVERSAAGGRPRSFSAEELVALGRCFNVSPLWFFMPPVSNIFSEGRRYVARMRTPDNERGIPAVNVVEILAGQYQFGEVVERAREILATVPASRRPTLARNDVLEEAGRRLDAEEMEEMERTFRRAADLLAKEQKTLKTKKPKR